MSYSINIDRNNSFTLIRYFLAINVFIGHYNVLTGDSIFRITSGFVNIGSFFCFSGFFALITYKEGMKLSSYLKKRIRRLVPPYAAVVIISTICLGFISSLGFSEYIKSSETYKYLICNLFYLNFIAPDLPGVFDQNLTNAINGSLWYMKVEWLLTLSVPFVVWIKNTLNLKIKTIALFLIFVSSLYRFYFLIQINTGAMSTEHAYRILKQFPGEIIYFYMGVILYLNYKLLTHNPLKTALCCLLLILTASIIPYSDAMAAPVATCVTMVSICVLCKWGELITRHINFSYGLYLTHYPIIQTIIYLLPTTITRNYNMIPFIFSIITTWMVSYLMNILFRKIFP